MAGVWTFEANGSVTSWPVLPDIVTVMSFPGLDGSILYELLSEPFVHETALQSRVTALAWAQARQLSHRKTQRRKDIGHAIRSTLRAYSVSVAEE